MSQDENQDDNQNPRSGSNSRRRKPFTRMIDVSDQFMWESFEMGADLSGDERNIQAAHPEARPEERGQEPEKPTGLGSFLGGAPSQAQAQEPAGKTSAFSSLMRETGEFQMPPSAKAAEITEKPQAAPPKPDYAGRKTPPPVAIPPLPPAPFAQIAGQLPPEPGQPARPAASPPPAPSQSASTFSRPPAPQSAPARPQPPAPPAGAKGPQTAPPSASPLPVPSPFARPLAPAPQQQQAPSPFSQAAALEPSEQPARSPSQSAQSHLPQIVRPIEQAQDTPHVPSPFARPGNASAFQAKEKPYVPAPFAKHAAPQEQLGATDLDDLIFNKAKSAPPPADIPVPPNEMYGEQSASARHRAIRRADFTRPRIPSLDPPNKDIIDAPPQSQKQKRGFGDRLKDFLHAFKRLFKDD